ncbi:MAG: exodeoxyribonuclease VII large subunit [Lachnospiraceae bacterium]|nr:exodeoxyribonuclease VII large subunit [Lachnospiraceae bacterium]
MASKNIYTVSSVNSYIKNMFTQDYMLRSIYVKGEVSNVKYHSSGHIYFTMKDESSTLSCVMFSSNRKNLKFKLEEGMKIIAFGSVEVYTRDGKYQLYAQSVTSDGQGDLHVRFEQLKKTLEEMGMFSSEYKKPIPKYAKRVGVVTAPTGAAIRDIINVSKRRNPYIEIILCPAQVQGEGAKESIVGGIKALEGLKPDVIIVGRGGGSIEDLWAFNEEEVARAIFDCQIPVISAVGHETDTTIADFVADLRAPTPSAAAELAVFDLGEFFNKLKDYDYRLNRSFGNIMESKRTRYERLLLMIGQKSPEGIIREKKMTLAAMNDRFNERIKSLINADKHKLSLYAEKLEAASPLKSLKKGYALIESEGSVVGGDTVVKKGDTLLLHMINKEIDAKVLDVREIKNREEK